MSRTDFFHSTRGHPPHPDHLLYIGAHFPLFYTLQRLASAAPHHFNERIEVPRRIIVPGRGRAQARWTGGW
jgi:hypothetical protein